MKKISQLSVQRVDERIVVKNEFKNLVDTLFMTAFLIKAIAKTNKIKPEEVLDILKSGLSGSDNKDGTILLNIEENQNQKAIECLKEVKKDLLDISNGYWKCFAKNGQQYMTSDDLEECLKEYIDTKIKELEGEKE